MKTIEGSARDISPPTEAAAITRTVHALDSSLYSLMRMVQKSESFDQVADLYWNIKVLNKQIEKLGVKPAAKPGKPDKVSFTVLNLQAEKRACEDAIERIIRRISPMGV